MSNVESISISPENGYVGIGNSQPTAALHIVQQSNAPAFRVDDEANDTTPFIISTDGNVGVGTTLPEARMDIHGSMRVGGSIIPSANEAYDLGSSNLRFKDIYLSGNTINLGNAVIGVSPDTNVIEFRDGETGDLKPLQMDNIKTDTLQATGDSQFLSITASTTTGTGALVVSGGVGIGGNLNVGGATTFFNGNVGIGTTNPSTRLQVDGTVTATDLITTGNITNEGFDFILGNGDQSTRGDSGLSRALVKGNNTILILNFDGDFTGGTSIRGSQLHVSGNVGIGQTNPLARLHVQGTTRITGDTTLTATTASTTTGTGALVVSGGVGIGSNLNVGGNTAVTGTSTLTGAATLQNTLDVSGITKITNSTTSTTTGTGALVVSGGVGIGGNLNVGGALTVTGTSTLTGAATLQNTLDVSGITKITNSTTSTTTGTGALVVSGGVGIGGNLNVGGALTVAGNLTINGTTTSINTATVNVEDNILKVNANQTGTPSNLLLSGIEVERGNETNYLFVFEEASQLFKVGMSNQLQAVATRPDTVNDRTIAIWDNPNSRYTFNSDVVVTSAGNVGIGTTNPLQRLHIQGTCRVEEELYVGPPNGSGTIFLGGGAVGDPTYDHTVIQSRLYASTEKTELLLFKGNDVEGASGADRIRLRAGVIAFDTFSSATTNREEENIRMYIAGDGSVGIGTTNPLSLLHVQGTTRITGNTTLTATTASTTTGTGALVVSGGVGVGGNLNVGGATTFFNGNVGIGTANPLTLLSISPSANGAKITLFDGGSTTTHLGFGVSPFQLNYHVDSAGVSHVFYQGGKNGDGTELMRITGGGHVGIGTNAPWERLHVNGSILSTDIVRHFDIRQLKPSDIAGDRFRFGFGSWNNNNSSPWADVLHLNGWVDASGESTNALMINKNDFGIRQYRGTFNSSTNYSSFRDVVMNGANDNVGIGTTNPLHRLDINGNILLRNNGTDIPRVRFTGQNGTANEYQILGNVSNTVDSGLRIERTAGGVGSGITLLSDNVGIGTANPQAKLHVNGTSTITGAMECYEAPYNSHQAMGIRFYLRNPIGSRISSP
jgi:hypothetical protein